MHSSLQKWSAEFIGTFWLTFGGCGSAVLAAAFPQVGIGLLGVSLAFGLTVLTGAYALGPISGGHFNPAVSIGLAVGGRFKASELPGYIVAQVLGAIVAGGVLYLIATGKPGAEIGGFATNGYGTHSPGGYGLMAALLAEVVLTAVFLVVILGATAPAAAPGFGGLAIGLCLTLIHLISIPVTNTSVNPARSTGVAVFGPEIALSQLWVFWAAPIVGAAIGALVYRGLLSNGRNG
ncbi:aquaporin Z [Paenacidovorax monticola]|uniref:Aquaporin Z n=1 Tax=Paenacidovorax monticola TaxID=1926868 RepID=A0A7H0HC20_9BURK|nr:aquaporin Z [Paenacidovorax monticola]QNP58086.1 aquaporin Z [Paenacidovorax monticola]